MTWSAGLTGAVLAVAQSNHSPLRVMAGPGTGKSTALKRRVARLLEVEHVDPERVLAVTFTRNAARSLLDDLHGISVPGCEDIRCGTLHAFCFSMLARGNVFEYLGRVPRALVTFNKAGVAQFEYQPMLQDLGRAGPFGAKRDCTKRIHAFEADWARLQHEDPGWPTDPLDQQFHDQLLSWLQFHEAILIGELVPEALRFLRNNPGTAELHAFDHVAVDEYQDLNKAEQVLLDHLSKRGQLVVVGDVDQSIYRFRFANPEGMLDFVTRHPQTRDEPLQECHRCPKMVVRLADHLIRHNHPATVPRRLKPNADNPDGEVHIVQWDQVTDEAAGLGRYVEHLRNDRGYKAGDILILCPRRLLGYGIRDVLRNLGIPVHSFYHEEALEDEKAQEMLTLLTLLANPDDRVSLRFWLGFGSPSWRSGEYARLRERCEETGMSPREVLEQLASRQLSITRTGAIQKRYEELASRLAAVAALNCAELVDYLFPDKIERTKVLRDAALPLLGGIETAAELLDELRIQITQPEMPQEGDYVRVMSLHKSKGLTSRVAIVAGCIEGLVPTIDTDEPPAEQQANLEEQRRLFYVAMTRCREILVLSSVSRLPVKLAYSIGAQVRGRRGICRTIASRFLAELGPAAPSALSGDNWIQRGYA